MGAPIMYAPNHMTTEYYGECTYSTAVIGKSAQWSKIKGTMSREKSIILSFNMLI